MKRKAKLYYFDHTHHCIRFYIFIDNVLDASNTKYNVTWYQYVHLDGTIGGIGSFGQQLSSHPNSYHRKGYANAMKKRISDHKTKYLKKLGESNS